MRDSAEPIAEPTGAQPSGARVLQGKHVLATLLVFFGAVFAVNGYFLYSALRTHTGVVALEPYRKGLAYNERIKASDAQALLGWRDDIRANRQGQIDVKISESNGAPVTGLTIVGTLTRPATGQGEVALQLVEAAPGHYSMVVPPIEAGAWLVAIEAHRGAGGAGATGARGAASVPEFRARRRLWLEP